MKNSFKSRVIEGDIHMYDRAKRAVSSDEQSKRRLRPIKQ